jgi:hypothetical protein
VVAPHTEADAIEHDELGPPDLRVVVENLGDFLYFKHPFGPGVQALV